MISRLPKNQRGVILLLSVVILAILLTMSSAIVGYTALQVHAEHQSIDQGQALALAEAGVDKAISQLNTNSNYAGETSTALGNGQFSVSITTNGNTKQITATGYVPSSANPIATKIVKASVSINTTAIAFNFGVQVGAGGITMNNGSSISGNIYSNGSISGRGTISGSATVAGANSISGVSIGGTAKADSMDNCTITGDAYYASQNSCTVGGIQHSGSADPAVQPMPVSSAQLTSWESTATAGGVSNGNMTINGSTTLGPKKITGNLSVSGTLNMTGPIWVVGNITFSNGASLTTDASLGNSSTVLIADNPGNLATSGIVTISNNVTFSGNGNPDSYPMVISTNSGAAAIDLSNNANGAVFYAANGTINLSNNVNATQLTGYSINLSNNATITYSTGLANADFSSGPGGSWQFQSGSYFISK